MTAVSNVLPTWTHGSCQGSACADKSSAATSATAGSAVVSNAQPSDPATTPVDSQQASLESVMAALRRALNAIFTGGTAIDNVASVATAGLHATVRDSAGIVIHTQEGDTIRIRYSDRVNIDAAAAQASDANGSVTLSQASLSQHEHLRVSIDGNLNADELKAVNDVLGKVESLAQEFFGGDTASAFAHAADLNINSAQLADVAVHLSQRESVSVATTNSSAAPIPVTTSQSPSASPSIPPPPVPPQPIATPTVAQNAEPPEVVTQSQNDSPASESAATALIPSEPLEPAPVATQVPSDQSVPSNPVDVIAGFVAKLTSVLHVNGQDTRLGFSFQAKLQLLIASIQAKKPDSSQNDTAVNKLQDVATQAANAA